MRNAILVPIAIFLMGLPGVAHAAATQSPRSQWSSEQNRIAEQASFALKELFSTLDLESGSQAEYQRQTELLKYWHRDLTSVAAAMNRMVPSQTLSKIGPGDQSALTAYITEVFRVQMFGTFKKVRSVQKDLLRLALDHTQVPSWIASAASVSMLSDQQLKEAVAERLQPYSIDAAIATELLSKSLTFEITDVQIKRGQGGRKVYAVQTLLVPELTRKWIEQKVVLSELGLQSTDDYYVTFLFTDAPENSTGAEILLWDHLAKGVYFQAVTRAEISSVARAEDAVEKMENALIRLIESSANPTPAALVRNFNRTSAKKSNSEN